MTRISEDLVDPGYNKAEKNFKAGMPQSKKARYGDLGEILASELAEEKFNFKIPKHISST